MKITTALERQAAVEALEQLIISKNRPVILEKNDIVVDEDGQELKLPKNVLINDPDADKKDEEDKYNSLTDPDSAKTAEEKAAEEKARIDRFNDPALMSSDLDKYKDEIKLHKVEAERKRKQEIAAKKAAAERERLHSEADLKNDIFRLIKTQVSQKLYSDPSYKKVNTSYANTYINGKKVLAPGNLRHTKQDIPSLNIYIDQSGSFGEADIEKAKEVIASLATFERQKLLKVTFKYFATVLSDSATYARSKGSGTTAFGQVMQDIVNTSPTNVMVISDSDIENQTRWGNINKVALKGGVFWVWKNGDVSNTAMKWLVPERPELQFKYKLYGK